MRSDYDLHVHSTFSDGTCSPKLLIEMALRKGLTGIAITDHDTIDGLEEARQFVNDNAIELEFIPGIELNTESGVSDNEVHILGYYIDYNCMQLKNRLLEIREQRQNRARRIVDKLNELGCKISYEKVVSIAGSDLIARPHIARAMVEAGYATDTDQAFNHYLEYGKPAYIKRYKFPPQEAIELIKESGGIAVLAHPGLIKNQSILRNIIDAGIEGLEVYYPQHSNRQVRNYLQLAQEEGLLLTGGSDYHGPDNSEKHANLGAAGIDSDLMTILRAYKNNIT